MTKYFIYIFLLFSFIFTKEVDANQIIELEGLNKKIEQDKEEFLQPLLLEFGQAPISCSAAFHDLISNNCKNSEEFQMDTLWYK